MKKVKRWRYYCDHCKKSGGSAYHMKNHEKVCTLNPDRNCGFCNIVGNTSYPEDLLLIVKKGVEITKKFNIDDWLGGQIKKTGENIDKELLEKSGGCPACTLAAIRQTKDSEFIQFDYEKSKVQFWKDNPRDDDLEYYP